MWTFNGREIRGIDSLNYAIVFISWNKTARVHYLPVVYYQSVSAVDVSLCMCVCVVLVCFVYSDPG